MTNIAEFVKGKDFSSQTGNAKPLPEGKTTIDLTKTDVESTEVDFGKGLKKRYLLNVGDETYWAGNQIMEGIQQAQENGFSKVTILRKGQGMNTKYTVMPLQNQNEGDL